MPLFKNQSYLKWAGGKRRLIARLRDLLPPDLNGDRYHEPFLGAASMFLALQPSQAHLADLNRELIESFRAVKNRPRLVAEYLDRHRRQHSKKYYYEIRDKYNSQLGTKSIAQGARFIYLNRACFNGIFRVNKKGKFNVPCGEPDRALFPRREHLQFVSKALESAELRVESFEKSCARVGKGDFVYLDPPYPPLNGTAYFRHYTAGRFNDEDQVQLANLIQRLEKTGARFMLSNADTKLIRDLYQGFFISELDTVRWITSKSQKVPVQELVITNYDPGSQENERQ